MTAALAAPASNTVRICPAPMPPIATTGFLDSAHARRSPSGPTTVSGSILVAVANTGPKPM
jgi:hypothetical protein